MMKKFVKNTAIGLAVGCFIFVCTGIIFDCVNAGSFSLSGWGFTKMALGSMLVGLGFSLPTPVYENQKLPLALQTLIHMGIGCTVMMVVAFNVGWIPLEAGWRTAAMVVTFQLLIAFLIWLGILQYSKHVAKKMNARIEEMQKKEQ